MIRPRPVDLKRTERVFHARLDCVGCIIRQAQEAIAQSDPDLDLAEWTLRRVLRMVARADWTVPPPALGQQVYCEIRRCLRRADPYAAVKKKLNAMAAALYPKWSRRFREVHEPLEAAVRLAIVGDIMDVNAKTQLNEDSIESAFADALAAPLLGGIQPLAQAISQARQILYLADNAAEILFDRDLLAQLPVGSCTFVVRGGPVLNDATCADAQWAHLEEYCEILDNGSDASGTLLEDCSPYVREQFVTADLIIAKGQGNLEFLIGVAKNIFFPLKLSVRSLLKGCPVRWVAWSCGTMPRRRTPPKRNRASR